MEIQNSIIKSHLLEIEVLCQNYGVKSLYAIGDACCGEVSHEDEINFLIDFNGLSVNNATLQKYKISYLLEKVLQHKIEIKTESELEEAKENKLLLYKK